MSFFKLIFFGALAFFSAVAIFMGVVVVLTSLQNGAISLSYTTGGQAVDQTVRRAVDAAQFWRLFAIMGLAPVVLGVAAMWYSVRQLRAVPTP